jgi:hypothetical protein
MAKWLDKYEQGGLVLKKKTKDNYDLKANPNDVQASVGPGFVGAGYDTTGRHYSPAWGGQFQWGGFLQPNDIRLPSAVAPPNKGDILSSELARSIGGEDGEPAYLVPSFKGGRRIDEKKEFNKTGEYLGGPFKTWQEADKFDELRHEYVEKGQPLPSPLKWWGDMAMGGGIPGTVGFTYARTAGSAPANGKYTKKTKASAQLGKNIPTMQDSLRVYNSALNTMNYYKNDKRHLSPEINEFSKTIERADINEVGSRNLNQYRQMYKELVNNDEDRASSRLYKQDYKESKQQLLDKVAKAIVEAKSAPPGIAYYKDAYPSKIDINAPSAIVDERIKPQGWINFKSSVTGLHSSEPAGSVTGLWYYDPLAVKPYNMRTEEEKIKWNKKYGKETPKQLVSKPTPKPEPAPVVVQKPVVTPIQQPTPQPKPLYNYDDEDAERIFAPVPSGGGGAFVGIKKKDGTIEYVKPEDYKRMGVPNYGQEYIKAHQKMQNGGEMRFYQQGLDFTPKTISKNGSVIKDDMGQWAHPGEITEINSNEITMEGVPYNVIGISDEGDIKDMKPGKNYKFKGSKVTEYPKGGWLNKYK